MFTRVVGFARRREDGASAVEFAIVAQLLFLLVFGIIQFGIFFAQDLALSNGARQAARAGAVSGSGTCQDILDELRQGTITVALDGSAVTMFVDVPTDATPTNRCTTTGGVLDAPTGEPCANATFGDELRVTATYDARLILPIFSRSITLEREGLYRCEYGQPFAAMSAPTP